MEEEKEGRYLKKKKQREERTSANATLVRDLEDRG